MSESNLLGDAKLLARLKRLQLQAQVAVDGIQKGMHRSSLRGISTTFAQHREYVAGDDVRHLDWKIMARSDKNVMREYEEETDLCVYFVLDASHSMAYGDKISKLDYATHIVAALSRIAAQQNDRFALAVQSTNGTQLVLPPTRGLQQWHNLCGHLARQIADGEFDSSELMLDFSQQLRQRSVIIWLSDFLDEPELVTSSARALTTNRHDLWALRILDGDEVDFPFKDLSQFEGLEDELLLKANPLAIAEAYRDEFENHARQLRQKIRSLGCTFRRLRSDASVEENILQVLASRARKLAHRGR
ncbi:MAG: DUF58 domain-containing protein [Planctomycetota bacterium]|jgi:uncharacterized protein (DUF58 family)|nr:DUF58 domain-containing protein [Planctomycetota bacterium]